MTSVISAQSDIPCKYEYEVPALMPFRNAWSIVLFSKGYAAKMEELISTAESQKL